MAKTLEAHDKLIREIFEGSYQFEIPDYQRPYAWTTEQAGELFDDLVSAMQDARVTGASSQYFLGSIVLIKNDREPKSSVVDGQQRLSTLTMLFAVLRATLSPRETSVLSILGKVVKSTVMDQSFVLCPHCQQHRAQVWGDGRGGRMCRCPDCGPVAVGAADGAALVLDEDWLRQKMRLALGIESRGGFDDLGSGVWRLGDAVKVAMT
ncbi:MAG: DUF262 domain-containing protein [Zoogloeaceae bacterium]|jgi:hypothetical protein|nr:DUF262 domain-containing protein [Zoogloeaceae bacterium]